VGVNAGIPQPYAFFGLDPERIFLQQLQVQNGFGKLFLDRKDGHSEMGLIGKKGFKVKV
jgi:hypothetical protein